MDVLFKIFLMSKETLTHHIFCKINPFVKEFIYVLFNKKIELSGYIKTHRM